MAQDNDTKFVGNLTEDPDLRHSGAGTPVVNLRLASNRRWTDKAGQQQEDTTYMTAAAFGTLAANAGQSLKKGDRVLVTGELQGRSYENRDGQTVHVTEIRAYDICPSLKWATAVVTRNPRNGQSSGPAPAPHPADQYAGGDQYAPAQPDPEDVPF